ncbi:hypothetical protein VTJ49DRAFT_905 [Mycothermus thermophilus]|uniref:PNPLA domain-containing protein n=1 Tax=Humicola insolens TaxID=85995 RepID=A0ABR3VE76_HUMIN
MTDVTDLPGEPHHIPGLVLVSRLSRPKRVRIPARVSIVPPSPSDDSVATDSDRAPTPPGLRVPNTTWKRLVLTLDGGGIRGYSSLIILRALMHEIARLERATDTPALSSAHTDRIPRDRIPDHVFREGEHLPCHYFDYVAGTSLGGLVAIMLGMFGMNVDHVIAEFRRQNKSILLPLAAADDSSIASVIDLPLVYRSRRNTWPTKRTRAFFDAFARFAATATAVRSPTNSSMSSASSESSSSAAIIRTAPAQSSAAVSSVSTISSEFRKDLFQCQTLAWCTEVEAAGRSWGLLKRKKRQLHPYAFCSFNEYENDNSPPIVTPEVAKAITAPSRFSFKPFKLGSGHYVDGSRLIRDPTLEVIKELTWLLEEPDQSPPIDLLLSLGTDEQPSCIYEKLRSFFPLDSATDKDEQAAAIREAQDRAYNHYHRFEVPAIKLGWRRKPYIDEIERTTEAWLAEPEHKELITRYASMLVERRRARAATDRWESFALGVRYVCFHEGCPLAPRTAASADGQLGQDQQQPKQQQQEQEPYTMFKSRGDFFDHLDRRHALLKMAARKMVDLEAELDKGRRFGCT